MEANVGVFLASATVIASVSGMLYPDYGYSGYPQNQATFRSQVAPSRSISSQVGAAPTSYLDQSTNFVKSSFYDYFGLGKSEQTGSRSSQSVITNSHPQLTETITGIRNFFRWFLPIPGIIFDGVMTLVRLPLTSVVLGTEGVVSFFDIIGQGTYEVITYPIRFGFKVVRWFLGPFAVVFWPLTAISYTVDWVIRGLARVFIVFPVEAMALISISMIVEAIHALRFVILTIVNLPLNTLVDFLSSEIAVLNWWG